MDHRHAGVDAVDAAGHGLAHQGLQAGVLRQAGPARADALQPGPGREAAEGAKAADGLRAGAQPRGRDAGAIDVGGHRVAVMDLASGAHFPLPVGVVGELEIDLAGEEGGVQSGHRQRPVFDLVTQILGEGVQQLAREAPVDAFLVAGERQVMQVLDADDQGFAGAGDTRAAQEEQGQHALVFWNHGLGRYRRRGCGVAAAYIDRGRNRFNESCNERLFSR
ncbi:MAG: hypothetical protein FD132_1581 [bacterium]|nr:MAG: hypothetical protein FD132_1581 [bacterium]